MTRSSLRKSFSPLGFRKPHFLLANQFGKPSPTKPSQLNKTRKSSPRKVK
ncbi:MAG: hypothetical protein ABII80_03090 [bacterium]